MAATGFVSGDPLVNHTIEGYHFIQRIGEGSYGVVYMARHPRIPGRLVAVKYLEVANPDDLKSIQNEIDILARLQHPNIVAIYDAHRFKNYQLIVMELVRGGTLQNALEKLRGRLDLHYALGVAEQLAFALGYIHNQKILHLDLKPGNVLLDPVGGGQDARPLLTDFGISRMVKPGGLLSTNLVGTPIYMSPEHFGFGDNKPDHRSDIYSLGIMLYELVTGRVPFAARDLLDILNMHAYSPVPLPSMTVPDLPPDLDLIVMQALEKDPAARFQSANDLGAALSALRDVLRGGSGTLSTARPGGAALGAIANAGAEAVAAIEEVQPPPRPAACLGLRITRPDGSQESARFDAGTIIIGRDASAGLRLDHPSISRRHAQIDCGADGLSITDLGSVNGTFFDGAPLPPHQRRPWEPGQFVQIQGFLLQPDEGAGAASGGPTQAMPTEQVVILLDELGRQQRKPRLRLNLSPNIVTLEPGRPQYVQLQVTPEYTPPAHYELRARPGPGLDASWFTLPAGQHIQPGEMYPFDIVVSAPEVGTSAGQTHELVLEVQADQPGIPPAVQVLKLRIVAVTRFALTLHPSEVSHNRRRVSRLGIGNSGNQRMAFSIEVASPDTLKIVADTSRVDVLPGQEAQVRLRFRPARGAAKDRRRLVYSITAQAASGLAQRVSGSYVFPRWRRPPIWLLLLWIVVVTVAVSLFMFGIPPEQQWANLRAVIEQIAHAVTGS